MKREAKILKYETKIREEQQRVKDERDRVREKMKSLEKQAWTFDHNGKLLIIEKGKA